MQKESETLQPLAWDGRAYRVAFYVTRSAHLAEEAVQEAYVALSHRPPPQQNAAHARNYFYNTVRNIALGMARAERRRVRREENYRKAVSKKTFATERVEATPALAQAAWAALNDLPSDEREAVRLCCGQGFTYESAARVLAASKRSVESRIQRGLKRLRRRLAAQGWATPPISERRFSRKGTTS
jgi:RNA polymerase sigma-70 factor (ECF subfamily)